MNKALSDFFPTVLRGHGSARRRTRCVLGGCKGGGAHEGKSENIDNWSEDRGLFSRRADMARKKQRKADEAEVRARGKYTPAARLPVVPPFTRNFTCDSCGRIPTGKPGDEGLYFRNCGKCWKRGYPLKHQRQQDGEGAAA